MPTACLVLVGLLAGVAQTPAPAPRQKPACQFSLSAETVRPEFVAPAGPVSKAYVLPQPDSPIAIVRADLSGINVNAGTGGYDIQGAYALDLRNFSDRTVTRVGAQVRVRTRDGGTGSGSAWSRPLQPGAVATLRWRGGGGTGTAPEGEVEVVVLVDSVELGDCLYRPAQALRILREQK